MFLALNTFVYEVGRVPIEDALKSAYNFGFRFIDYAAYNSGDPTTMSKSKQKEIIKIFKDLGKFVDNPDYWVKKSLEYLNKILPDWKLQ
jgi:hypothetical protein